MCIQKFPILTECLSVASVHDFDHVRGSRYTTFSNEPIEILIFRSFFTLKNADLYKPVWKSRVPGPLDAGKVMYRGYRQTFGGYGGLLYTNTLLGFEAFENWVLNFREFQVSVRDFPKMLVLKKSEWNPQRYCKPAVNRQPGYRREGTCRTEWCARCVYTSYELHLTVWRCCASHDNIGNTNSVLNRV